MLESLGSRLPATDAGIIIGRGVFGVCRGAEIFFCGVLRREVVAEGIAVGEGLGPLLPAFTGIVIGGRQEATGRGREVFARRDLAIENVLVNLA